MRRTASQVIRELEKRIARLERTSAKSSLQSDMEQKIFQAIEPLKKSLSSKIKDLSTKYEKFERDGRVKEDEDDMGGAMGSIQPDHIYLGEDALKDIDLAVQKITDVVEDIATSVERLEEGLSDIEGKLRR